MQHISYVAYKRAKSAYRREKCQNVFLSLIEGLLPGTSGSAARGLLGLWSIQGEIEKKKSAF